MDKTRFDELTRSLFRSRRAFVGGTLGLAASWPGIASIEAKKKRKHKKHKKKRTPKATPNAFGCLEVGDPCASEAQCCSGICEGKKCRAHDVGTCDQARPGYCAEGNPNDASCNGAQGVCFRTTGASNVCINNFFCADCRQDADCQALGYPSGSACLPVTGDLACAPLCQEDAVRMACGYYTNAA